MKVYISADIEGVAGITHRDECDPSKGAEYERFRAQMTAEVRAACQGALAAGATEIWVKDAHWHGRNLVASELPREVRLIRGWSGHPYSMMQELDSSFDAALYVGYHSRAGSGGHPLAHTFSSASIAELRLNGQLASEFLINSHIARREGVPSVFLSGDEALCLESRQALEGLETVATSQGVGASTLSIHPELAVERIREGVRKVLSTDFRRLARALPPSFRLELEYKSPLEAYKRAFYPGARLQGDRSVLIESGDYFEILRALLFAV